MLTHDDPELRAALAEVVEDWEAPVGVISPKLEAPSLSTIDSTELDSRLPLSFVIIQDDDIVSWRAAAEVDEITSVYREFAVYSPMTVTIPDLPRNPTCDEMVIFKVGADSVRREFSQRDGDILASQQLKEHWPEVQEAMLKELLTWAKLNDAVVVNVRVPGISSMPVGLPNSNGNNRPWMQPLVGVSSLKPSVSSAPGWQSEDSRIGIDVMLTDMLARVRDARGSF
jgi:hypothetical protein